MIFPKKLLLTSVFVSSLLSYIPTSYAATEQDIAGSLTQIQENDLNNARAKTEILKNTLDHQTTPTPYYDPKAQSTSIAPQATANKAFSTRPGQFLVTTDTASSASSAWAGGHAAIVYSGYYTIESFGNRGNENGVRLWSNDWNTRYSHFQLRSVSGTTAQQDTNAAYAAYSFLNKP